MLLFLSYALRIILIRISPDWNVNRPFLKLLASKLKIRISPDWNVNLGTDESILRLVIVFEYHQIGM